VNRYTPQMTCPPAQVLPDQSGGSDTASSQQAISSRGSSTAAGMTGTTGVDDRYHQLLGAVTSHVCQSPHVCMCALLQRGSAVAMVLSHRPC
jgi:hypothetical protein